MRVWCWNSGRATFVFVVRTGLASTRMRMGLFLSIRSGQVGWGEVGVAGKRVGVETCHR